MYANSAGYAMYFENSIVTLYNCLITCNSFAPFTQPDKQITLVSSTIFFEGYADPASFPTVICDDSSSALDSQDYEMCNSINSTCIFPNSEYLEPAFNYYDVIDIPTFCVDSTCHLTGSRLKITFPYYSSLISFEKTLGYEGFTKAYWFSGIDGTVDGYFSVSSDSTYDIRIEAEQFGVLLKINHLTLVNSLFQQNYVNSTVQVKLRSNAMNHIQIKLLSTVYGPKSLKIEYKAQSESIFKPLETFFSNNICGDGIYDTDESNPLSNFYCPNDINGFNPNESICGDNICNESPFESCLRDFYYMIGSSCPSQAQPTSTNKDYPLQDTIAELLNVQHVNTLPGLSYLSYGVDMMSGQPLVDPIFDIGYCSSNDFSRVSDPKNNIEFTVPSDYYAEVHHECPFADETYVYGSPSEISEKESLDRSMDLSGSADLKISSIQLAAALSNSQSEAATLSRSMNTTQTESFATTTSKCIAYKVSRDSVRFSNQFVKDMGNANNQEDLIQLIRKYGTYYYKSASLGGKLEQIASSSSKLDEENLKKKASKYFRDSIVYRNSSNLVDLLNEVNTSTILINGGLIEDNIGISFKNWSSSIPSNPVPVDYKLSFLGDIIPIGWLGFNNTSLKTLWFEAFDEYLKLSNGGQNYNNQNNITILFYFNQAVTFNNPNSSIILSSDHFSESYSFSTQIESDTNFKTSIKPNYQNYQSFSLNSFVDIDKIDYIILKDLTSNRGYFYYRPADPNRTNLINIVPQYQNNISIILFNPIKIEQISTNLKVYLEIISFNGTYTSKIDNSLLSKENRYLQIIRSNLYYPDILQVKFKILSPLSDVSIIEFDDSLQVFQNCGSIFTPPPYYSTCSSGIQNQGYMKIFSSIKKDIEILQRGIKQIVITFNF